MSDVVWMDGCMYGCMYVCMYVCMDGGMEMKYNKYILYHNIEIRKKTCISICLAGECSSSINGSSSYNVIGV